MIGTSTKSWEDAAGNAVAIASRSLRDPRIAEVSTLDMKIEGGTVVAYRVRVLLSWGRADALSGQPAKAAPPA